MSDKRMCVYCGRRYPAATMTAMHEDGKTESSCYCESCLPAVKKNIATLHYRHLFTFGKKGEV